MVLQPLFNQADPFETKNPSRLPTKRALLWYLQAFVTLNINLFSLIEGYSRALARDHGCVMMIIEDIGAYINDVLMAFRRRWGTYESMCNR